MQQQHKYRSLSERLAKYNLTERQDQLVSLLVEPNQIVEMNDDDPAFESHHAYLKPERAQDLKRWIGIPNDAIHVSHVVQDKIIVERRKNNFSPRFMSQPTIAHDIEFQACLYPYLFGVSEELDFHYAQKVDELLLRAEIIIGITLLLDIYVSAGAQLVIPARKNILFARYIYVEASGVIQMKSPLAQIDCAGFRRLPAYRLARDPTESPWNRPALSRTASGGT